MTGRVIIIGAPRSGTNMLRDVLTRLPDWTTWPCDEIPFVWRHGNKRYPDDELPAALARPRLRRYIEGRFERLARRHRAEVVVEKTCANSLRVDFVHRLVPDAKFVFIRRDGIDAAASALQRWDAPLDLPYVTRKARYVPYTDLPYYAGRFAAGRVRRGRSRRQSTTWGPRFAGMEEALRVRPTDEVSAMQWQRCVEASAAALAALPDGAVHEVRYENFVCRPQTVLTGVLEFLGTSKQPDEIASLVRDVTSDSIGKGRRSLSEEQIGRLTRLIEPTLERFSYA